VRDTGRYRGYRGIQPIQPIQPVQTSKPVPVSVLGYCTYRIAGTSGIQYADPWFNRERLRTPQANPSPQLQLLIENREGTVNEARSFLFLSRKTSFPSLLLSCSTECLASPTSLSLFFLTLPSLSHHLFFFLISFSLQRFVKSRQ
jgi:hypothetical protein